MKIRLKFNLFFMLSFFLASAMVGLVMFVFLRYAVDSLLGNHLESLSSFKELSLNTYIESIEDEILEQQSIDVYKYEIEVLSEYKGNENHSSYLSAYEFLDDRYGSFTEVNEGFEQLFFVDKSGYVVYQSDKDLKDHQGSYLDDLFDLDFSLFDLARNVTYFSGVFADQNHDNAPKMIIAAPLFLESEDGRFVGEIVASVSVNFINDLFNDDSGLGETGESLAVYWVDGVPTLLNDRRFDSDAELNIREDSGLFKALNGEEGIVYDFIDYRGEEVVASIASFEDLNIGMVVKVDKEAAYDVISNVFYFLGLVFVVFIVVFIFVIYSFSRSIIGSLDKLRLGTEKVAEGDFGYRINMDTNDEFGEVARAFDAMLAAVKESRADVDKKIEQQTKVLEEKTNALDKQKRAVLNILEDVSEEKVKSENLAKDLQKFKLAVENASDHIVITDKDGTILFANPAVNKITGFSNEEIIGQKVGSKENWGGLMKKEVYEELWKTIKVDKKTFTADITNKRKNGEKYIASASIAPVLDANDEVLFFVGIERDITKAKEVDRMKTEFISLASHQLRTPLSAMRWFSEMLLAGDAGELNSEQKDFVNNIYESNQRMIGLVNSLLNISRIESGRIIVDPEPTNLLDLVKSILSELEIRVKEKNINVLTSMNEGIGEINIDPKLIGEVYKNLLTNAIKYSPEGSEITIFISEKDGDVISQVSDTGYGIPKGEQHKMFQKFFRAENAVAHETDGNGLGMYLVKAIVESSGGKIWFESEEGEGTSFWFSLPKAGVESKEGEVHIS